ncbi:Bpu10I family restriction endonuclease [Belnapia moabensis]|uniref:Bpu10I family restriction endonuclease n=1 Tax=Belnapia moabensis TaxID=365533 RepID=UPI001B80A57A|nr:Bpu10I family restriction endonuclease [Belnapia moabensis]
MSDDLLPPQDDLPLNQEEARDPLAVGMDTPGVLAHGANITQKENHRTKYRDRQSRQFIAEIRAKYDVWHQQNIQLKGPGKTPDQNDKEIIRKRVKLFSDYKDFIDLRRYAECFDSRSNLHSSVLEEFIYYLFRDMIDDFRGVPLVGKSSTFKDLFFMPGNYAQMLTNPSVRIERKNHDFVIGATYNMELAPKGVRSVEKHALEVPAVAIECKTYLDKTMLEGSSGAADQLKARNPNALYIVVMEWLKLTDAINIKKYRVDQIYVFRKQKNTDREFRYEESYVKNPIDPDVVFHLYEYVRNHLTRPWGGGVETGLQRGYLL